MLYRQPFLLILSLVCSPTLVPLPADHRGQNWLHVLSSFRWSCLLRTRSVFSRNSSTRQTTTKSKRSHTPRPLRGVFYYSSLLYLIPHSGLSESRRAPWRWLSSASPMCAVTQRCVCGGQLCAQCLTSAYESAWKRPGDPGIRSLLYHG